VGRADHWSHSIADHVHPRVFTNQVQAAFWESGLLVMNVPRAEPLTEALDGDLPAMALPHRLPSALQGVTILCKDQWLIQWV
jgi:hypothetical protein